MSSETESSQTTSAFNILMNASQTSEIIKPKTCGRISESEIHNYFNYNKDMDKSKCKVSNCDKELKGKKSTNLVSHLRSFHKLEYKSFSDNENDRKSKKIKSESIANQTSITTFATKKLSFKKYDKNDPIMKGFMLRLVKLVSTTSIPISLVEKREFRDLIHFLDEKIQLPARNGLVNECLKYFNESKNEIIIKLKNTEAITLGADIWSKKGLSESYLGVTAYFFDKIKKMKCVLTLGLKLFPHPHKAENIRDQIRAILDEYNIKYNQISRVITDNGSNMVKTFKIEWIDNKSFEDIEYELEKDLNIAEYVEEDTEECDVNEFYNEENVLNSEFEKIKIKRISCVIHILQCIITACNKTSPYKNVLRSATELIKKFRQSGKLAEKLKSKSGSVIPTITPTRWNSVFLQMNNLITKKSEITQICSEANIDNLKQIEWKLIEEYVTLYKPFNEITNEMSRETETTISKVISSILFLTHHFKDFMNKGSESAKICSNNLLIELNKRFDSFLNPENDNFSDGIYIAATFLDPRYIRCLNDKQCNYAKSFIKEYFKIFEKSLPVFEETEKMVETSDNLSQMDLFMEQSFSQIPVQALDLMIDLDKQIINWLHFNSKQRIEFKTEPLDFWLKDNSISNFFDLKNIALNILCTPSSTATVERVFSAAGNACIGRKNRLSNKRLEMIVFLKNNAKYLNTLNFFK